MTFTIKMALDRVTKGSLRYQEVDDSGKPMDWGFKVGQLYVRKEAFNGEQPPKLTITVKE